MKIDILTLFPPMFQGPLTESIVKRAEQKGIISINIHNIRDITNDKHHTVDDTPYGGGPGMVMRVDVADRALAKVTQSNPTVKPYIILTTPQGNIYNQKKAIKLSKKKWLIIICGHFEGYDERVRNLVDEEISIGDIILTGGEIPAMAIIDSVVRLLPGGIGKAESTREESFTDNLLEYPQYTRPQEYKGKSVPQVLLSGNHQQIAAWRHQEAVKRTQKRRPDLAK
ncbi:MAG: tRNA (guanosine(37)-N1)-methyltransferase TrmD [bacterium]|nr:tRNA (guanosine(37)-N1)-methyltransferase TrmD [bacterium]